MLETTIYQKKNAPTAARAHIMCQPAQRVKEVPVGSQDPGSPHRTTRAARASNNRPPLGTKVLLIVNRTF